MGTQEIHTSRVNKKMSSTDEEEYIEDEDLNEWRNILQSVEVAETFSYGSDPSIEEFQESQVSYPMYLRLKRLAETMRCHIKPLELLHIMRDHWKRPDSEMHEDLDSSNIESYFIGILRNYILHKIKKLYRHYV